MAFTPVAIVGQGCVLPGAPNPDALSAAVNDGRDLITQAPKNAWPVAPETIAGPDGEGFRNGHRQTPSRGGFVDNFDAGFDPSGFLISTDDVAGLDRSVRWLFDAARQAVRDARYDNLIGRKTAIVIGNNAYPTASLADMAHRVLIEAPLGLASVPPTDTAQGRRFWANRYLAGRPAHLLAQAFGGSGPAFCLDAACASSLYAVKLACDYLADGTADVALAGGFSGTDNIFLHLGFSEIAALSPSGMSRPFCRHADGLLPAEGAAVLALKRLDDAVRCGDRIHGVIRGVGVSNDGNRGGLLAPDRDGQITALRRAYASAALDPASLSLLECHATGTPTGDRVELESAQSVFGAVADLPVGSLKSNLGHLITASGAAAIIKLTGAMAAGLRPATLHAEEPLAEFADGPLRPLLSAEPWPDTQRRLAGISNFGFGGNNAHLVLEEYVKEGSVVAVPSRPPADPVVLCGIGLLAGDAIGLDEFSRRLFADDDVDRSNRLAEIELPLKGTRFPPADLRQCLGQQTAVLRACAVAVDQVAAVDAERCGVIIGMGCDVSAARPGMRFRLGTTLKKLGARVQEHSEVALTEAVGGLVGADYVMGAMPNLPANRVNVQHDWRGFGYTVAAEEVSGFVAMEIGARALQSGELDMAVVGAVDLCHDEVHRLSAQAVLPLHAQRPADAAIVFVLKRKADAEAAGDRVLATVEIAPACSTAGEACDDTAMDIATRFGHSHAADAMVKTAAGLASEAAGIDLASVRPCLTPPRPHAVQVTSFAGQSQKLTLHDVTPEPGFGAKPDAPHLHFATAENIPSLACVLRDGRPSPTGPARIAIVAGSRRQLEKRIADAARLIDEGRPCKLPGVFVGDTPVDGDVAFVYPGTAAWYPRAVEGVALAFPEVAAVLRQTPGIERVGVHFDISGEDVSDIARTAAMTFVAALTTRTLRDHLGLKPDAAIGLSVGEVAMLVANGIWPNPGPILDALDESAFYQQLTGDHTAVVPHLDLPDGAKPSWENYEVLAPVDHVEAAIAGVRNVWITVVSSPIHCGIGGTAEACAAVISRLDQRTVMPSDLDLAFHGPYTAGLEAVYRQAHTQPVAPSSALRLYSNATHSVVTQAPDSIADNLSHQLTNRVDFRPTIEQAWADGARVFVDMGPRNTLTPAIDAILGDRPHLAVGIDSGNRDGLRQFAETAGALFAAGLPVDLATLARRLSRLRGDQDGAGRPSSGKKLALPAYLAPIDQGAFDALRHRLAEAEAGPASSVVARVLPPAPPRPPARMSAAEHLQLPVGGVVTLPEPPARATMNDFQPASVVAVDVATAPTSAADPPRRSGRRATEGRTVSAAFAASSAPVVPLEPRQPEGPALDRAQLEVLAGGRISSVFGPLFQQQDAYLRQCRMPEPPLLLADRVLGIAGEPGSMGKGICWTETDIAQDAWYLHNGTMPTGLMIEAGQADLLLISWLGADFLNRGDRVYRLLGCEITFHEGDMPCVGDTIRFQIHIDSHAELNGTRMFFFRYDARVGDRLVSSVRSGQAGFFTDDELANSGGVLWSPESDAPKLDARVDLAPGASTKRRFTAAEVRAFADGDAYACFGDGFEWQSAHQRTPSIPAGRMQLIDGVSRFDPAGGPWGRGYLKAEYSVPTDAWFYNGHFKNDPCMPGTLMAEAATQALAFHMAALGLTRDRDGWVFRPVAGEAFKFVCRGQVVPDRPHNVSYEVFVEEIVDGEEPTVFAALLASCDGQKVFLCRRFGLKLVRGWPLYDRAAFVDDRSAPKIVSPSGDVPGDFKALMACAWGRPSDAFGSMYRRFDRDSSVPRLPGPPYHCVSRIVSVDCERGIATPGGKVVAEFDVDPAAWYFADGGNGAMPFSVLSEVLLQPCGWLASYMGFALGGGLKFRNLDGEGVRTEREVTPDIGTLAVEATFTKSAFAGPMTIVFYEVVCRSAAGTVLTLKTDFGFFPPDALASQKGLPASDERLAALTAAGPVDPASLLSDPLANDVCAGSPTGRLAMVDAVTGFWPEGGKAGLGRATGRQAIDPAAWYFKAHFFEDPVQAGSLGLEALFSLLKATVKLKGLHRRFKAPRFETPATGSSLGWKYRGQVVPTNKEVLTEIDIVEIVDEGETSLVRATGSLWVDGLRIYEVSDYCLRIRESETFAERSVESDTTVVRIDPEAKPWLKDHKPTFVIPAYPMLGVAGLLLNPTGDAPDAAPVTRIDTLEVRGWLMLDAGPLDLEFRETPLPDGRTRMTFHRLRDGMAEMRPAGMAMTSRGLHEAAPETWPLLESGELESDPYGAGGLFHDGAFQMVDRITWVSGESVFSFDAAKAWAAADGDPAILLDALFHGFPHYQPDRWYGEAAADKAALPYRLERFALHEALPRSGSLTVLTRRLDMPTARTLRFGVQAQYEGRVFASAVMVEALVPTALHNRIKPVDRRGYCQRRVRVSDFGLSTRLPGCTSLAVDTLQAANWLPGTFEAIYDVPVEIRSDPRATVEQIAIKDHVAAIYAIHPAEVGIADGQIHPGENPALRLSTLSRVWVDDSRFEVREISDRRSDEEHCRTRR